MRTSIRNQFAATVKSLQKGAVNAEVVVSVAGNDTIVSQITLESVQTLGLAEGCPVVALIKSSWVALATGETAPKLSTRNILVGTVASIKAGAVNSEVVLTLSGGESITSVITEESVKQLGLSVGSKAWAVFKANAVILAVE